ncbi:MAG: beta-propeller domain-containing protein, partial [Oscillospiraceae bacterium]|nr:beta-propeller domain-containing protein [Oscillospiraceae bacterium]
EDFIRLLREKAEDTPVPMALEPSMMMARLEAQAAKKKTSWLKVLSPVAMAVTACFAVVLAGRSGDLTPNVPAVSVPSSQTELSSEPSSEVSEPSSEVSEPSSEISEPSSVPAEESVPSSEPEVSSEPENEVSSAVSEPSSEVVSEPSADDEVPSEPVVEPEDAEEETAPPAEPLPMPGETSSDSSAYGGVYRAMQLAATPENAQNHYATRVLSAGISADGLQMSDEKAIVCEGNGYFYVSRQNSPEITVVGADGFCDSFTVQFGAPDFEGMTVSSSVITHCEVVNGQLFAAGTVNYTCKGKPGRTVSAVAVYDLSDPSSPRLTARNAQDGTMIGLKEANGYLYLFSRYYPDSAAAADRVEAYVPCHYGVQSGLVAPEDIVISEYRDASYIVASVYSSKDPSAPCDILALQGGGESYYLGDSGLYLFGEQYGASGVETKVSALCCEKGSVRLAGETDMTGVLNWSDSPNEYGGRLRVLTTSYGKTNATNLFVFDRELNLLGSKEGIAEDRILRSVRFERNRLYFSLYEDRNAVYAIDLLIPESMNIYSAELSEEALRAVNVGDKFLRLSGENGRKALCLTLQNENERFDKIEIDLSGSYSEEKVSLQTYEKGRYAAVTYTDSGTQKQVVRLYEVEGETIREVLSYECSLWNGGVKAYMHDGRFFVVSFAETASFDVADGSQIGFIEY